MIPEKRRKLDLGSPDLSQRAKEVVDKIAAGCQAENGFGDFSISLYDTAWLSMVTKADAAGSHQWAFPESFNFVLHQQREDGSWGAYSSPVDGILNTLAGVLSLLVHQSQTRNEGPDSYEPIVYEHRISKGIDSLSSALNEWDVEATVHVGFEVLVPSLLSQLAQQGIEVQFPGKGILMQLHQQKLAKFVPEMVTGKHQTTLLHSLEGLIGKVDFDQLAHHCTAYGGMLGSPASTAAYLIQSTHWDDAAEKYLRNVIRSYGSCGGVPSGFPTPVFETSWTISTLLASGFAVDNFANTALQTIGQYLQQLFEKQNGLLGFAPGFLADADDTARTFLASTYLGSQLSPSALVKHFEAPDHFQTYRLERNPSFSANANILLALLRTSDPGVYTTQIKKAVRFILAGWNNGQLLDKWNLAPEYSEMLLTCALTQLVKLWTQGQLRDLPHELVTLRLPIALCQLLSRCLSRQSENGSWAGSPERTAYCVLLLSYILELPWPDSVREIAHASLNQGQDYLSTHADKWTDGDYIWVEKVTYKLPILSETYCLAAMKAPVSEWPWTPEVAAIFSAEDKKLKMMATFFGRLPLFQKTGTKTMLLAVMEAKLYSRLLKTVRLDIFPRDEMRMTEDKYIEYIPAAWCCVNAATEFPLAGTIMWDMMVISMLNYQADEYMETAVAQLSDRQVSQLKSTLRSECFDQPICLESESPNEEPALQPTPVPSDSGNESPVSSPKDAAAVIRKYIHHVRRHPCVTATPELAQHQVADELYKYLLAQIAHNADNQQLRDGNVSRVPYFDWVRTTGANDTSCPYSFAFFCCLVSQNKSYCLVSAKARYFARAMVVHLATLCRQYNDYGSSRRDAEEGNLKSLDFEEFKNGKAVEGDRDSRKHALLDIATCEKECMELYLGRLSTEVDKSTGRRIKAFVDVTDLFGQIYVARDIASKQT
ncbi:Ent-kaurene synthase [Aspergillus steynii IBT 23096]|uniref:Ent-kaurene synthase n=1 Tax=Aspergillus steynii IBT 23096 TaxID=1392250 RepID=A0A2I2GEL4_9EURO|nr:Ent-kaurene synthase [Aspergillus steynii IBT 23096]PLB51302.1 Ent-kaurene synthase [Aspergillus steynii IBT 23096]